MLSNALNRLLLFLPVLLFSAGAMSGAVSLILDWQLDERRALEVNLRAVRAELVTKELKEWFAGNGNWYAAGTFRIVTPGLEGDAEASLLPQDFYAGRTRGSKVPREQAAPVLNDWQNGQTYAGFIYSDQPARLFFQRAVTPEGEALAVWLRRLAGGLLLAGIAAYWLPARRRAAAAAPKPKMRGSDRDSGGD